MIVAMLCLPYTLVAAQPQMIVMGGQYNEPSNGNFPNSRAPAQPIVVKQVGHNFTFNIGLVGEIVEIVRDEAFLYTTIVGDNGCVDIPTDILGEVELRLYRGKMMYHAIVEL